MGRGQAEKGTAGLSGPPVPEAPNLCFIASFLLNLFSGHNHIENNAKTDWFSMLGIGLKPSWLLGFYDGGAGRSRTDLLGFAIRCITALLPRRVGLRQKREAYLPFF